MSKVTRFSKESRAKATETRSRRSKLFNTSSPARDRRDVGEVRKLSDAVAAFCAECCGFDAAGCCSLHAAIEDCQGPKCHLYLWRNGKFHDDEADSYIASLSEKAS